MKRTQKTGKKSNRLRNIDGEKMIVRLRAMRKEKGYSQSEVARKIGVSHSCVANWENGSRTPQIQSIKTMARIYGVPIDYVCGLTEHRYDIKVPDYFSFDLTKLNSKGIDVLHNIYKAMLSSPEYSSETV